MVKIIDSHSHIYLSEFSPDSAAMLKRAEKEGVMQILMPAIDSGSHMDMLAMETANPEQCMSMMGVHPCSIKENFNNISVQYTTRLAAGGLPDIELY